MADLSRYIEDGKVNRVRIANDIAAGKFTQEFLSELLQKLQKPELKANYFSHVKLERKPESEWTKEYLNLLSNAVVAENFNEEYLRYLFDVAQYVHQRGQNNPQKKTLLLVAAVAVLLVCLGLVACVRQCRAEKDGGGDYVQETR
ncbi:MAG: hypothetical protein IJX45_02725 [Spirochaetaceae bacterium]|nr:hypothetical protein [Spirochaetaceae bacterium]MBQ8561192.1 hypothetical protein [Spirochaetaceae bacterium]